jgi:hypothetical protein
MMGNLELDASVMSKCIANAIPIVNGRDSLTLLSIVPSPTQLPKVNHWSGEDAFLNIVLATSGDLRSVSKE